MNLRCRLELRGFNQPEEQFAGRNYLSKGEHVRILARDTDGYIEYLLAPALDERGHDGVGLDTSFYRDGAVVCR